jgi:hypothetical protein
VSRSLSRWQAVVLGFVVIAGVGVGSYGLFRIGQRERLWGESFELRVGFPEVNGVDRGTPVRVLGMEAGHVVAVDWPEADGDDEVVILRLQLDDKYRTRLYSDATASIVTEGMIGSKVIAIQPGKPKAGPITDGTILGKPSVEISDLLRDIPEKKEALYADMRELLRTSKQFMKSSEAAVAGLNGEAAQTLREVRGLAADSSEFLRKGQETVLSVKQDADAIKRMPIVRSYVEDPVEMLVRPAQERDRRWVSTGDVFEPGRAVIDPGLGRVKLNEIAAWLNERKVKGSEVVIVTFHDPASTDVTPQAARTLTQAQSDAVLEYLKYGHKVHKINWYTTRKMSAVGYGTSPTPVVEKESMPAGRVEVVLFVPQS